MSRLLNESWIEGLPDNIVDNLEALNRYVVLRLCARIKEIGDIGTSDSHRLMSVIEYAGADMDAIEKEIARIMAMNQKEVQQLFEEVAAENIDFANTYYAARGMEKLKSYQSRANLIAFVESAKRVAMEGTSNLSHTHMIGFKRGKRVVPLREYYISAIDRAVTFVRTGTVDYQTAMRSTVRDMARSGLRRVTFDSGYSRRLDSQARMNILEGVRRLNADMMEETGKEFGADGVEISAHGLCAPDHQPIQGRQFSNKEYERLNQRLQRPIGTLNCHHFATPIILGVSKPVHSDKELREINARSNVPVEYRGKTMTRYEASQKQRQLETAIRYAKDERDACVAAGDKIGAAQARKRSATLGREYKSFCEKAGLTPRPERTRSMTGPTVEKAPKILEKTAKSGIIETNSPKEIPDVSKFSASQKPIGAEDVTKEYLDFATPGQGTITYEDGYKVGGHQEEISMADWLYRTLGGDIKLLKEATENDKKRADFLWRGALWELKGPSSINAADKRLQYAMEQIKDNPGGVILDIQEDLDMIALERQLIRRMNRSKLFQFTTIHTPYKLSFQRDHV